MTPIWTRFAELYPWLVDTLARSGEVDMVIPVLLQRAAMDEAAVAGIRDTVETLRATGIEVPVYCCWVAPRAARVKADPLQAAGIPCLEWPERTARAIGHAMRHARNRTRIIPPPAPPPARPPALPAGPLPAAEAAALLAGFGVRTVKTRLCHSPPEAASAAAAFGGPVVMKAADPAIAHRAEVDGVRIGLVTEDEVLAAYGDLSRLGRTVLVQPRRSGVEMVVGARRDPAFGPVVMTGLGGTAVELLEDVTFALAPVGVEEAIGMIEQLRGFPLLTGYRRLPSVDIPVLGALIAGVSRLISTYPEITEIDLNPVIATGSEAVAVDWKLYVSVAGGQ